MNERLDVPTNLQKEVENLLENVCSENPLDQSKNNNQELIEIKLKDPNQEVNVENKIPYSKTDVEEFTKECAELLEKGILEESTSRHATPAFYVENHNEIKRGKRRMVINYTKMNEATIGDAYKLPRKDYILQKIRGSHWFSTLDAKSDQGFFKSLAKERRLLQKKLSTKVLWTWNNNDSILIDKLKNACKNLPKLYNPQSDDYLIVETDASQETWAGCMKAKINIQSSNNTKEVERLCKYISGTFSETEQRYPIHEKETLACLKILRKWRIELLTKEFELRTDSKYLTGFIHYKIKSNFNQGRLIRWQLELRQFPAVAKYIKSENNVIADTLTREWRK
ncbi:uncharacterized protein [Rutidosis leptorrhynchoides]|uniref:uncharacterized protein n=1 Tax=Rutidosis leptorrhynchoides TaxID=125765 RepID=UPI003A9953B2